ncbi:uncharacterized protein LOC106082131 [Stomoxys calcitrans]|uniref:uncharacterized protein LOC106082131 n=1 Tax=Stomoxys calcitrans TaxID=35570 RepID=UPI0027E2E881|nr:uncharacterized protein LOC106082131 [Stomoxys calcitrans]
MTTTETNNQRPKSCYLCLFVLLLMLKEVNENVAKRYRCFEWRKNNFVVPVKMSSSSCNEFFKRGGSWLKFSIFSTLFPYKMRSSLILLALALAACLVSTHAASYRRGDKISEHFKQLDLPPEEIDPNVAPLDSMNEVIFDNDVLDQAEAEAATEDNVIEGAGESAATTAVAAAAPAAAATNAPAVTSAAAESVAEPTTPAKPDEESLIAKYCKCSGNHCDCCRAFNLPFIPIKGPGCARMTYLGNEKMSVSLKYGDLTLITRTVSSKRARPICVGLPGGYSQFCGRIYGLSKASENFKACLGFELRADDEVEAALRVSCFKFGPEGLRVAEAEPLPSESIKQQEDDDEDDIFGFAAGGDDDDDDEDDYDEENDDEEEEETENDEDSEPDYADDDADNEEAPADADYGGFSLAGLLDELSDDDEDESKPTAAVAPAAASATPVSAATRNADAAQSKDAKGTESTDATQMMDDDAASTADAAPAAAETTTDTKAKTKKAKKAKKNKKKKAADAESGFAYQLLNSLLDFFN